MSEADEEVLRFARRLAEHPLARLERYGEANGRPYVAFRDRRDDEVRYAFTEADVDAWLATVQPHEIEAATSAEPSFLERAGELMDDAVEGKEEAVTRAGLTLLRWVVLVLLAVFAIRAIWWIVR